MLYTITGPSGSGKTALAKKLEKSRQNIARIISATTRKPRRKEVDGVDYYFKSREEFIDEASRGMFVEYTEFGSNYYGIPYFPDNIKDQDFFVILDRNGVKKIKEKYPELVRSVYIYMPPGDAIFRMARRDGWDKARMRLKIDEEAGLYNPDGFDCTLKNDTGIKDLSYNFINYMLATKLEKGLDYGYSTAGN